MVARAGRSRLLASLGLLILMVGFLTVFHNSQTQLDELRQLGMRCEQQAKSVQAQMEVVVDQKLRLENSLASERVINEANRKELKQRAKEEKEEHSKTSMEANIRYASLQQQCNLVKSQLGDLTEECSKSKKQQSEEINSLRLKVSELQGKVLRHQQESASDVDHLKAQLAQLKNERTNAEGTLRKQLRDKDVVIEKLRELATKMEKENAHYLERCKLPADQLPQQHHRYRDVLEQLSASASLKAAANPVHSFNEQLPVSEDRYRIPVALKARNSNVNSTAAATATTSTTSSLGLSVSGSSLSGSSLSPIATNNRRPDPKASEEQETRVIANPFEALVPARAEAYVGRRWHSGARTAREPAQPPPNQASALDGGIINSVENFQIIAKPVPAVAPDNMNVLQEPRLLKTSTSTPAGANGGKHGYGGSSDRNLQLPILAAPTVLPGLSVAEHSSKRNGDSIGAAGGGTMAGKGGSTSTSTSTTTTTTTTTTTAASRGAGVAPNRGASSAVRKPLANHRRSKPVPEGIVPFPDVMPDVLLEENISEPVILDNRYANVAAAAAAAAGNTADTGPIPGKLKAAGGSDKHHGAAADARHGDLNFMRGAVGGNLEADNGAQEEHDGDGGAGGAAGKRGAMDAANEAGNEGDNEQMLGADENLNAAEEDTNLYDHNGNGNKPFGNPLLDQQLEYNEVIPGAPRQHRRRIGGVKRNGGGDAAAGGGGGGADSKAAAMIDRMGDKLINEIAHDHGKEGDNYPNEMEDLHLVGNEAEEEDVSDYDDPTALKQGHAERH
uniref:Putative er-golgi vesicle-tethering protein n=1 Tax=Anopheles triannulatus TaxID=58253 RepID=A0A2M4AHT6_9DIPT